MAYSGSIDFVDAPFYEVNWENQLKSPWEDMTTASSWHTADSSCVNALRGVVNGFDRDEDRNIIYMIINIR